MSLLTLGVTASPAYAGKTITATVSSDASCNTNQVMTGVQVRLTQIPKWQKITVSTTEYPVTRDHDEWVRDGDSSVGTGYYSIAIEGDLQRVTAWISSNDWDGWFRVTGASCRNAPPPETTPPTAGPTTQPPTTESTTLPPSTTAPTTATPAHAEPPENPGFTAPGNTTVPGLPPGSSLSPSRSPSASTTPSASAIPSASHASAISSSAASIALTGDGNKPSVGSPAEDAEDFTTSFIEVVSNPVEAVSPMWLWFFTVFGLIGLALVLRRFLRPRSMRRR